MAAVSYPISSEVNMDHILTYLPETVDPAQLALAAGFFLAGVLLLGSLGKTLHGENSPLSNAASSAMGILFIYVATIVVMTVGGDLDQFRPYLSPLPFISIEDSHLHLFVFDAADAQLICTQVLSMVILAFLVNLLDTVIPRGNGILTWFLFRCATVVLAILAHWGATELITAYIPGVIADNASMILLGLLVLLLAVGCMKFLVGFAIATVNPIIAALYTFFFANAVGQQLSKSILTTALLTALVYGLNIIGLTVIPIDLTALMGYLPFLGVLAAVWYIVNQIL